MRQARSPAEAVPRYLQAIQLSQGQNAKAMYNLGMTYLKMDDLDSALEWYQKSVDIMPQLAGGSLLQKIRSAQAQAQAAGDEDDRHHEHDDL